MIGPVLSSMLAGFVATLLVMGLHKFVAWRRSRKTERVEMLRFVLARTVKQIKARMVEWTITGAATDQSKVVDDIGDCDY